MFAGLLLVNLSVIIIQLISYFCSFWRHYKFGNKLGSTKVNFKTKFNSPWPILCQGVTLWTPKISRGFSRFKQVQSFLEDHIPWIFLKARFHKIYLVHSWIPSPISSDMLLSTCKWSHLTDRSLWINFWAKNAIILEKFIIQGMDSKSAENDSNLDPTNVSPSCLAVSAFPWEVKKVCVLKIVCTTLSYLTPP